MSQKPKAKRLYVLAGYRASGKTTALNLAERRENFPIFPPETMDEFKLISKLNPKFATSSGFRTYDDFSDFKHIDQPIIGIHYDFVMPIQNLMQNLYKQKAAEKGLTLLTPKLWTGLLTKALNDGSIEREIGFQFAHWKSLSAAFESSEISIIMSDWNSNRLDWISRMERITSSSLEKQRGFQQHSFNIALFDDDLVFAERLYSSVHTQWARMLKKSGARHLWIQRTKEHYDVRATNFKT